METVEGKGHSRAGDLWAMTGTVASRVGSSMVPFFLACKALLTSKRQVSARQKVPDLPMPALQCTTMGPCSGLSEPDSRTLNRKLRKEAGDSGTPKSGHVV